MILTDNRQTFCAEDEQGANVIVSLRLELDAFMQSKKLPFRIEIRLPYEAGGDGMPLSDTYPLLEQVGEALQKTMERDKLAILAYQFVGGGRMGWVYYARNTDIFFERLNDALADIDPLPLEFEAERDTEWDDYSSLFDALP